MKKTKKALSVILVFALLLTFTAVLPVQSAVTDSDETGGGGYDSIYLNPGPAYMENTKWYAWTWFDFETFDDGFWMSSTWITDENGADVAFFDVLTPGVVFVCVPSSAEEPSWDNVIYQSPESTVPGSNYTYKVTDVTGGEMPNIDGKWIWSDYPDDPYKPGDISHESFTIMNPVSTGTYYVGEQIEIQVGINRYYYSYSPNGSRLNYPNSVVLEFRKNNRLIHTSYIQYHADAVGYYLTDHFTPTIAGTYTVKVGYAKNSIYSVSENNYVGTYTFRVLSVGDVNLDGVIDVRDVTMIKRHVAEYELLTGEQLNLADTNRDGEVTIEDATLLQMYLAEYGVQIG